MNDERKNAVGQIVRSRTSKLKRADLSRLMVLAVGEPWLCSVEGNAYGQIDFEGGSSVAIEMRRENINGDGFCRAFWKIRNCTDWGDIERLAKFKTTWQAMGPVYLDEPVPYDYAAAQRAAYSSRGFGKGGPEDTKGT